jgi:DNA-binding GntR family transcriptional regulator
MTQLAAQALRSMILSGELRPGDRVIENRLTHELGVSRPPLREAMAVLEQEGLLVLEPRRGAIVTPLTLHDVYEIFTLRAELERLAVELGVPTRSERRLERCRQAMRDLEEAAENQDPGAVTERGFAFHLAVVGLAGHRRLEDSYRSLALQMSLCMAMNRRARRGLESLRGDAARHRHILDLVEAGDTEGVKHALVHHGHRTFLVEFGDSFGGHSEEAQAWLEQLRLEEQAGQP